MCRYEVIMTQEIDKGEKSYNGLLRMFWLEEDRNLPIPIEKTKDFHFDPRLILGDLRNQPLPYTFPDGRKSIEQTLYHQTISCEYAFGGNKPITIENGTEYSDLIYELNNLKSPKVSQKYLDEILKKFSCALNYSIKIKKDISKTQAYALLKPKQKDISRYKYTELLYKNGTNNSLLTKNNYMKKSHQFCYDCLSMSAVICAIFHFLVLHNFAFRTCKLCSKLYSRPPLKGKFSGCYRKNPYDINDLLHSKKIIEDYGKSTRLCKDAIKYIKFQIRNDRKCVLTHINNYLPCNRIEFDKVDECLKHEYEENPCYHTLRQLVQNVNLKNRKRWYEKKE